MMIDYVTVRMEARLPRIIRGGALVKLSETGEVEWESSTRLSVVGSWESKITVRAVSLNELELSGNPAKFLQGHNIFGPTDLHGLIRACLDKLQPFLWPEGMPYVNVASGHLTRVDCTSSYLLDSMADVLSWIRAAEGIGRLGRLGKGNLRGASTLVYGDVKKGGRAKRWQLLIYCKGLDVAKNPLPLPMRCRNDVMDYVNRSLRFEVRLRSGELLRLGLSSVENWSAETCEAVWTEKTSRLDLAEGMVMECSSFEGVNPRLLDAYDAWCAGRDLRQGRKKGAFYRLRRQMLDQFGVDISNTAPKSNVVPLRRVLVAVPAQRPPWADEIAALLAA